MLMAELLSFTVSSYCYLRTDILMYIVVSASVFFLLCNFKFIFCSASDYNVFVLQVEVVEGVAGEEDHHDDQEEQGEENAEAEGQHDEHDEDGEHTS